MQFLENLTDNLIQVGSHAIKESDLKIGDHVYIYRFLFAYSHHGIVVQITPNIVIVHFDMKSIRAVGLNEFKRGAFDSISGISGDVVGGGINAVRERFPGLNINGSGSSSGDESGTVNQDRDSSTANQNSVLPGSTTINNYTFNPESRWNHSAENINNSSAQDAVAMDTNGKDDKKDDSSDDGFEIVSEPDENPPASRKDTGDESVEFVNEGKSTSKNSKADISKDTPAKNSEPDSKRLKRSESSPSGPQLFHEEDVKVDSDGFTNIVLGVSNTVNSTEVTGPSRDPSSASGTNNAPDTEMPDANVSASGAESNNAENAASENTDSQNLPRRNSELQKFLHGSVLRKVYYDKDPNSLEVWIKRSGTVSTKTSSPQIVIALRALASMDEYGKDRKKVEYDLLFRNCELFCEYCTCGADQVILSRAQEASRNESNVNSSNSNTANSAFAFTTANATVGGENSNNNTANAESNSTAPSNNRFRDLCATSAQSQARNVVKTAALGGVALGFAMATAGVAVATAGEVLMATTLIQAAKSVSGQNNQTTGDSNSANSQNIEPATIEEVDVDGSTPNTSTNANIDANASSADVTSAVQTEDVPVSVEAAPGVSPRGGINNADNSNSSNANSNAKSATNSGTSRVVISETVDESAIYDTGSGTANEDTNNTNSNANGNAGTRTSHNENAHSTASVPEGAQPEQQPDDDPINVPEVVKKLLASVFDGEAERLSVETQLELILKNEETAVGVCELVIDAVDAPVQNVNNESQNNSTGANANPSSTTANNTTASGNILMFSGSSSTDAGSGSANSTSEGAAATDENPTNENATSGSLTEAEAKARVRECLATLFDVA